jgi:hypothetical protein
MYHFYHYQDNHIYFISNAGLQVYRQKLHVSFLLKVYSLVLRYNHQERRSSFHDYCFCIQKNHYYHNMWDAKTKPHVIFNYSLYPEIRQYRLKIEMRLESHFHLLLVNLTIQARRYAQLQVMKR